MLKGFTLIELCIVLAITAGVASFVVPSIDKMVKRAAHVQRVNTAIKKIYENQRKSCDTGVVFVDDIWYTPFDVEPHVIEVDDERIIVQSFYIIQRN